jgi:acetylornithine/succinyldiaminopimelate/putrescine aminotransferase
MGVRRKFKTIFLSLVDLLGMEYVESVISAASRLTGQSPALLRKLARQRVDFFPAKLQQSLVTMLPQVGRRFSRPLAASARGASTLRFDAATRREAAPLSGLGYYRVGEDGRLYFLAKSEHYHAPLGHAFEGYRLVDYARKLGIPNAAHNNTRGYITRRLEEELVRTANGLRPDDKAGLSAVLRSTRPDALNRVLNLQTGSLACEAGIKMMLARFYRPQADSGPPVYAGRMPVIIVIGDTAGGRHANYHGTTIFAQMLRGMWPEMSQYLEKHGLWKVVTVRPNDPDELESIFLKHDTGRQKIAGLLLEPVLMNYGGIRLTERFVRRISVLCRKHNVPILSDEIQTCLWNPQLYMFREYKLRPSFVVIGKGFAGGEYAASRIIFSAAYDSLPQFGALVTNGQEELASLTYLITMRWAQDNAQATSAIGEAYQAKLRDLVGRYPQHLSALEGRGHLASLHFHDLERAKTFVSTLVAGGLDISVQTYKAQCPPGALTKLPLIAGYEAMDMVVSRMDAALREL